MTFEAGKFYRTRGGGKVWVAATNAPNTDYPVIGMLVGNCDADTWTADGHEIDGEVNDYDLIDEWREPRVAQVTLYAYESMTRSDQLTWGFELLTNRRLLAKKTVLIKEGEGL